MKKLIIQIPCWNEAETVSETILALPTRVEGFDSVEVLVIIFKTTRALALSYFRYAIKPKLLPKFAPTRAGLEEQA